MNSVQENKNELEAAVRYCESAISRAQATIESMEFRQQAASKAWHEQTGREAALAKENLELEERNDELNAQIVEQTGREAALEREVTRLKGIIAEGNNVIDESRESRADLLMQIEGHRTNMALLSDEIATLKDQLGEREDKWDKAQSEIATLERDLDASVDEVTDLKLENTRLNDRLMISVKEVGDLQSEVDELAKAYKDSTNEEITMKKAWREQRELVALRDDQIAMLERRLAKYTGEKSYPFKEGDLYYVFNQLDGTWIESVWDDESERIHDTPSLPNHPHKVYFTIDQKNVLDKFKPEDD